MFNGKYSLRHYIETCCTRKILASFHAWPSILFGKWLYSYRIKLPCCQEMTVQWNLWPVCFICACSSVHTVSNELEDSSQMKHVMQTSLALCSTIYITTSFFGFLLFGDDTLDDVLANFDFDLGIPYSSLVNDIVRVSYAIHLMLVFPIVFFALRLNIDGLIFPSARPLSSNNKRFVLVTVILISLIFTGANFIPNIWVAFQLTGATAAACIGFIFPAAIFLKWVLIHCNYTGVCCPPLFFFSASKFFSLFYITYLSFISI